MNADPFAAIPARPRDVGEWEDLLIRFELGPRALRNALAEADSLEGVAGHLAHLARIEVEAGGWLRALREGAALTPWEPDWAAEVAPDPMHAMERYTDQRNRNFAWVQRRGIDVWEWSAAHPEFGSVTAFQLISYLVRHDGHHLARIRDDL